MGRDVDHLTNADFRKIDSVEDIGKFPHELHTPTGADLADVGHQLGHSSPRLTKRYAPVVPDKLKSVGESVRRITSESHQ